MSGTAPSIDELVETSRVDGRLYVDSSIFEEELRRIWYGNWVYVGHESEVAQPGQYCRKRVGLQEVILNRDIDGRVHVLFNRCPHRGNLVCMDRSGRSAGFRCTYHGWTFSSDGRLSSVPYRDAYNRRFDDICQQLRLNEVEDVASYAGFVFCSLTRPAQTFEEYLRPVRFAFDQVVGLSPERELDLTAGWLRHHMGCNWKIAVESFVDHYHPRFVHQSMFKATGAALDDIGASGVRSLGGGHVELGFSANCRRSGRPFMWVGGIAPERLGDYIRVMEDRFGKEEVADRFLAGPAQVTVFPNLCLAQMNVVVFQPVGVAECTQETTPVLFKGAPELNRRSIRQCEGGMGPAGLIIADDAEIGERTQVGLGAMSPRWLELSRGLEREQRDGELVCSEDESDETGHRGFWQHYARMMSSPGVP